MKVKTRRVTTFLDKASDSHSYSDAQQLADWLNMPHDSLRTAQEQTADLIRLLQAVGKAESPTHQTRARIEELLRPIQQCPWKLVPRQTFAGWYPAQHWAPPLHGLVLAARLAARGLEWVRRCPCGTWFVARSAPNRFHSDECREAFWKDALKMPEGRERRRLYMRDLRAKKKKLFKSKRRTQR
jgi:hypothetical protein